MLGAVDRMQLAVFHGNPSQCVHKDQHTIAASDSDRWHTRLAGLSSSPPGSCTLPGGLLSRAFQSCSGRYQALEKVGHACGEAICNRILQKRFCCCQVSSLLILWSGDEGTGHVQPARWAATVLSTHRRMWAWTWIFPQVRARRLGVWSRTAILWWKMYDGL